MQKHPFPDGFPPIPAVDSLPDLPEDSDWGAEPVGNEAARLAALHGYRVLDTGIEDGFERITLWAKTHFNVPIALVSLVDADRQWFKSACGLDVRETPRDVAFCNFTIMSSRPTVVEDAAQDPRFENNPLVLGEPGIRFYAGAPIMTADGYALGSVCVIDRQPRRFGTADRVMLKKLAALVMAEIEQRDALRSGPPDAGEDTPAEG